MVARNRTDARDAGLGRLNTAAGQGQPSPFSTPRSIMAAAVLPGAPTSTPAGLQCPDSISVREWVMLLT